MKFRTLGVALLMGSGLALTAVMASPATAQPYPPAGCTGPFGTGTVTPAVVEVGDPVTFSGCGFEPFTIVQVAVDGVPYGTVNAQSDTTFTIQIIFDTPGTHTLTATGQLAVTFPGTGDESGGPAELSTGGATGADFVGAQLPFLTRVVTGTVLVVEEDKDDHEWPDGGHGGWGEGGEGGEGEGGGGWPTSTPTSDPSTDPTSTPTVTPTTVAPTTPAAPTVAPVETVYPPHVVRPPHHSDGLPFTGVETGALAAIAVALVGGGLLIRVAARKRRNAPGTHS